MYCSSLVVPSGEVKARSALSVRVKPGGGLEAASTGAAASANASASRGAARENTATTKFS
jgi:hypothetical protein